MSVAADVSVGLEAAWRALPEAEEAPGRPAAAGRARRRAECGRCGRPAPGHCLCPALPPPPGLRLAGRVLVLQHPREAARALATVPLLRLAVAGEGLEVAVGRKVLHRRPELRARLAGLSRAGCPVLLLFPSAASVPLDRWLAARRDGDGDLREREGVPAYCLMVLDGTWQEAKEMHAALLPEGEEEEEDGLLLHPVRLPAAGTRPPVRLRTEPAPGLVTTVQAVAEAVHVLEGDARSAAGGDDGGLRAALLRPLERLAKLQSANDAALRSRLDAAASDAGVRGGRRQRPG